MATNTQHHILLGLLGRQARRAIHARTWRPIPSRFSLAEPARLLRKIVIIGGGSVCLLNLRDNRL
jgi:hypothetical protein